MNHYNLEVEKREHLGKSNKVRNSGYIPGVLYGKGMEATPIQIKESVLSDNMRHHGQNTIFNVNLNNENYQTVIRDLQVDHIKNEYLHVDLQRISLNEKREAKVPIRLVGKGKGEALGGVFNQQADHITVWGLPADVPEYIEINVSDMKIGEHITASDLLLPEGLTLEDKPTEVIVTLSAHRAVAEDLNPKDNTPANAVPIIGNDERETKAT